MCRHRGCKPDNLRYSSSRLLIFFIIITHDLFTGTDFITGVGLLTEIMADAQMILAGWLSWGIFIPHVALKESMIRNQLFSTVKRRPFVTGIVNKVRKYTIYFPLIHILNKFQMIKHIDSLRVDYARAAANLNSGYSKYAKVARLYYFCTNFTPNTLRARGRSVGCIRAHSRALDLFIYLSGNFILLVKLKKPFNT